MNSSYAPLVLIGAMFAMAAYASISGGPDGQMAPSKSPDMSQQAAAAQSNNRTISQASSQPSQAPGSQASNDQEGAIQAAWDGIKEAGQETADFFTGEDVTKEQAQQSGQSGSSKAAQASHSQGAQRDVKVYTTQGQEVGAITAIILNHENNGVRAIVISNENADFGSSNYVDEKLRTALCGGRAQRAAAQ